MKGQAGAIPLFSCILHFGRWRHSSPCGHVPSDMHHLIYLLGKSKEMGKVFEVRTL